VTVAYSKRQGKQSEFDLHEESDRSLIERIRSGDRSAFDMLYLRYHPVLWEFAMRYVRAAEVAEDVCHEVFLTVWTRRETLEVRASIRSYLYGATRNRALAHLSHLRIVEQHAEAERHAAVSSPSPDEAASEAEMRVAVERGLQMLPDDRRRILMLRWTHGLGYPEIARIMGISEDAARAHVSRARKILREFLGEILEG
jgi:RNA polymerase sigma-70 factor, ECF subfamily